MELVLDDGNNDGNDTSSSDATDIVSNIERALENPQIRQMAGAIMAQNGIDPSQMGIEMPENTPENAPTETNATVPEPESEPENGTEMTVDKLLNMIEGIAQESPLGWQTNLQQIHEHINENPDEIREVIEQSGLK